jgi:hypothetical protein
MQTLIAQPSWDLATLNTFVAQQENSRQGPLTKIANDGTNTTVDIDDLAPSGKPAKNAVIITSGSPPAGASTIGTGKIFVSGSLTDATAYRPA